MFADLPRDGSIPGRDRKAALTLVLSPLVAEVTLGSTPVSRIWLVLLWLPVYGAGALLVRELVRRRGGPFHRFSGRGGRPGAGVVDLGAANLESASGQRSLRAPSTPTAMN
jgi:hypothetical protein